MITKDKIDSFIEKIPPSPKILKDTLLLVNQGELTKAAKAAEGDLALKAYLKNIVNKPIYGFTNEVSDISQIFGILGLSGSQQIIYNYMISLLSPDKWVLFKLNKKLFYELQAELSKKWADILKYLKISDVDICMSIALLPSSIIVTEALFNEKKDDVALLRSNKEIDYNTILSRLCGVSIFDISEQIAIKWDMGNIVSQIVKASSGVSPSSDPKINNLGKWMHLLFFYELSQTQFIEAGLNDFVDFQINYVADIYDDFAIAMGIS